MNPEPMHTELTKKHSDAAATTNEPVFIGSGFGPTGRPGMTKIIS
jgi:hypothetical protein